MTAWPPSHPQHPYGRVGRHRAPVNPRPRRLLATIGLGVVAAVAIIGATLGSHPTVPTVQAIPPLQVAPVAPGHQRPLPGPGTVEVRDIGMQLVPALAPASGSASTTEPAPTTAASATTTEATTPPSSSAVTTDVPTSAPHTTTTSTPTGTVEGSPATTTQPSTTPTTTTSSSTSSGSFATCKAVTQ